ncbi:hypothetical protein [Nibricoccus sp. IMCC34717]|uniref:hypothetical protein n=1 Tax=Nibricoccus sp. IMCC34717 TaxID=3034021 RepID=UPI0038511D4C
MNKMKLLAIGAVAAATASVASAANIPVTIKWTGSSALRKATYAAVAKTLTNPKAAALGVAGTSADFSGRSQVVFTGDLPASNGVDTYNVTIQFAFAGSVGGVQVVDDSTLTSLPGNPYAPGSTYLNASNITTTSLVTVVGSGLTATVTGANSIPSAAYVSYAQAQVANSDSFQTTTPFNQNSLVEVDAGNLGVLAFYWVKGKNNPGIPAASYNAFTNFTTQNANSILANGAISMAMVTGNDADDAYRVLLVGRNNDSGTRLGTQAEAGYGFGFSAEKQYKLDSTSAPTTLAFVGDNGFASGGSVKDTLIANLTSTVKLSGKPAIFVGYVGEGDKAAAVTGGAVELRWNGVAYSDAAIRSGNYTFWTYGHTYFSPTATAEQQEVVNAIATKLQSDTVDLAGIKIDASFKAKRDLEGAVVYR